MIALKIDTKFEGKLACASKNWNEEFGKFPPEHLKVSKLGHWWGPFIQSRKCMSLKFTGEFCIMAMKNIQNLKKNQLVSSKLTWGIWRILIWALENLKNLHFNGFLLNKVYNGWAKKEYRRVLLDGTENWCNIWRKTD